MCPTNTVSLSFLTHLRGLYNYAINELIAGKSIRFGINGFTDVAPIAYVVAVAGVEAIINEAFLSDGTRLSTKESDIWSLPNEWLEKLDLKIKLVLFPHFLCGKTFARDAQPYQDMALLIKTRDYFVHYKGLPGTPKHIKDLDNRRITLIPPWQDDRGRLTCAERLCSSEGIRWAYNTVSRVIRELADFAPEDRPLKWALDWAKGFYEITESHARELLTKLGIDPDSNNPPAPPP